MKVILIQTPWSDASAGDFKAVAKKYAAYAPIGLMYLAAYVEKHGHEAEILDLEVAPMPIDDLCDAVTERGIELIGITASTPAFHIARKYAQALRKQTGISVVIGGPHITALRENAFADDFDFGVIGEGEQTLQALMNALENKTSFSAINGLLYREDGQIRTTAPRAYIDNLDSLPFPARGKIDVYKYAFEVPRKGVIPVATTELTRGCPFNCVFCAEHLSTGKKLRVRSIENVVDEMLCVRKEFGINHFFMLDSTLTVNQKLIKDFCSKLVEENTDITFEGQTRADLVDECLLKIMKKAGLVLSS